ncbi:MAG: hypothetical protein WBE76_03385 [Terracidiphilus sp.]
MATITTQGFPIPDPTQVDPSSPAAIRGLKHLPRGSRRAHRILSHAIEYLANEFLMDATPPGPRNSRLQAVQLLMALDRRVCSESAEVPGPAGRWLRFLRPYRNPAAMSGR